MTRKREFRNWKTEVRTQVIGGSEKIVGYAAVFNQLSESMRAGSRTFRERVMPGAFDKCLAGAPDIRGLVNHNPDLVLGRTKSGTMTVSTDMRGLRYVIDPPNTSYANDLMESLGRGDIDQSSFGFYVVKDNWINSDDGSMIRELLEVDCFDCSPVTYPAYTSSSSTLEARSFPDGLPDGFGHTSQRPELERRKRMLRHLILRDISDLGLRIDRLQAVEDRKCPVLTSKKQALRRMRLNEMAITARSWRR